MPATTCPRELSADYAAANEDIVTWLCDSNNRGDNRFLNSVHDWLHEHDALTPAQVSAVRRNMTGRPAARGGSGAAPATANECMQVRNGTYRLMVDAIRTVDLRIYTVASGQLAGKRVIKQLGPNGRWDAFAFLRTDGTAQVWRRWEGTPGIEQLTDDTTMMLAMLCSEPCQQVWDQHGFLYATSDSRATVSVRERHCNRCNEDMSLNDEAYMAPLCVLCQNDEARTPTPRRMTVRQETMRRPIWGRSGVDYDPVPTPRLIPLAMSEIDTTWVQ